MHDRKKSRNRRTKLAKPPVKQDGVNNRRDLEEVEADLYEPRYVRQVIAVGLANALVLE